MRTKWLIVILVLLIALLGVQGASAELGDEDTADAVEIIRLINDYRAGLGMNTYTFNHTLAVTAQLHSEYQAANNISTHKGEGGSTSTDRARAQGYNGDVSFFRTDEMIYNGSFATPQIAFDWWKESPIHNGIMTSAVYHEIGVGIAHSEEGRTYYTVNVGMIPNVTTGGNSSYRSPSLEEYKASDSIPIEVELPGNDGAIYHPFKQGETLAAIASAYAVPLDNLRSLNGFATETVPAAGQLLVIKLPTSQISATQAPVEATASLPPATTIPPTATATEVQSASAGSGAPMVEVAALEPGNPGQEAQAAPPQDGSSLWLWIVLGVIFIGAAAGGAYWYWPKLKKAASQDRIDLDTWLSNDLSATSDEKQSESGRFVERRSTTSSFDRLPRQQQSLLLQQVATQALSAYPFKVERIELLRYVLNAEFLIEARHDEAPDMVKKYVMRVNAPNFHTKAEIASELEWLAALNRDTKLTVPMPVKTEKGDWVRTIDHPALGIFRHCVLFEYLPAAAMEDTITPHKIEFLGAMIALLHRHGASYNPPAGFLRKHWDLEGLRGEMLDVPVTQALAALTSEERQVLDQAEEIVTEAMERLGSGPEVYGLIHGDLHLKSLLFSNDGRPVVIDFDTCGWGYYVYDLAVAVWNIFDRDDFTVLRDALLGGYRKVRTLSQREESYMIHFVAGRLMIQILTWAPRRTHSPLSETANKSIDKQIKQLESLLRILER